MKALLLITSALLLAAPAVAACACDPAPNSCARCCDPKPEENCPKAVKYLQDAENSRVQEEVAPQVEFLSEALRHVPEAPASLPRPEDLSRGSPGPRSRVSTPLLE